MELKTLKQIWTEVSEKYIKGDLEGVKMDITFDQAISEAIIRQAVKFSLFRVQHNVSCNCQIDWVDPYDYSAGHNGITGGIDQESITELEDTIINILTVK